MTAKTCPLCGKTYEGGGRFCPTDGAALRASVKSGLVPGVLLHGRYEIDRQIGTGATGVVYLAEDIRLKRLCALKVLRSDALGDDAEALMRFYREATEASRINHPHVVSVYNFDETEDGLVYLATEYVDGESLAERLDDVSLLSPRPAARIVWQTANALEAAHKLKIAHRDLKPANIMLTRYGDWPDFVKVVDFGIAKAFGTRSEHGITTTGQWVGTPAYMSPEQWLGGEVDHRSDIYSLGLLAVRMLAGGLPTGSEPGLASAHAILEDLPCDDWPDSLTDVLRRCLALNPEDRFQTATDFASSFVTAVDAWVAREPETREPWEARLRLSEAHEGRRPWGPAFVILLLVAVGIVGVIYRDDGSVPTSVPREADTQDSLALLEASDRDSASDEPRKPPGAVPETPGAVTGISDPTETPVRQGDSVTVAAPSPPPSGLVQRLSQLIDLSDPDPDSMRAAVELAQTLRAARLSPEQELEVGYRLAEASLYLGARTEACETLRDILPAAQASRVYARAVQALLDENCGAASP